MGHFRLMVNDIEEESLPCIFPSGQPIHAVFDLYGQCNQVSNDTVYPLYIILLNEILGTYFVDLKCC